MAIREYHLKPLAPGTQIYAERLEVAGVAYRCKDVARFVKGRDKSLILEEDPKNPHDSNAIRVYGCWKTVFGNKRAFIGYVPRYVAEVMVTGEYFSDVEPRLLKTYLGDGGYLEVLFQLIGPKRRAYEFKQGLAADTDHYSSLVDRVKYLKQQRKYDEAVDLLLQLVVQTESESTATGHGVAPWYYEQLAIIYRKQKRYDDEIGILKRYAAQPKAPGTGPAQMAERLRKAEAKSRH